MISETIVYDFINNDEQNTGKFILIDYLNNNRYKVFGLSLEFINNTIINNPSILIYTHNDSKYINIGEFMDRQDIFIKIPNNLIDKDNFKYSLNHPIFKLIKTSDEKITFKNNKRSNRDGFVYKLEEFNNYNSLNNNNTSIEPTSLSLSPNQSIPNKEWSYKLDKFTLNNEQKEEILNNLYGIIIYLKTINNTFIKDIVIKFEELKNNNIDDTFRKKFAEIIILLYSIEFSDYIPKNMKHEQSREKEIENLYEQLELISNCLLIKITKSKPSLNLLSRSNSKNSIDSNKTDGSSLTSKDRN